MGRIGTMIAPCAPNVNLSGAGRRVACATVGWSAAGEDGVVAATGAELPAASRQDGRPWLTAP